MLTFLHSILPSDPGLFTLSPDKTSYCQGAFGGPPIYATINGVRHEIRLGGPAPEVKIEPQPSHDLYRFMSQARTQKPVVRPPQPEPEQR